MTHICHRERRERKGKEKTSEKEKEKEKKAERSTVKMYYWNVALSEHCEDVPLECGSVHWNTEEVCEVAQGGHGQSKPVKVQFEVDLAKLEVRNMKTNTRYPLQGSGPL